MDQTTSGQQQPDRPAAKLPALSKSTSSSPSHSITRTHIPTTDTKVHKRPINRGRVLNRGGAPLSPKHPIIYAGTNSPVMGLISKVRKALDHSPTSRSSKGLPLAARMAALNAPASGPAAGADADEVLVRATGRAIPNGLRVAAWFGRQTDCRVSVRTMSLEAVDDVVADGEDGVDVEEEGGFAAEEGTRVRGVSCLEIGVSLR